jgi:hypothetical protein
VQRKFLRLVLSVTVFSIISWSCTKIDTTQVGADLIPAVDNVHTFADTLTVIGTQGILTPDSTRIGLTDLHVLGTISNDPLFGTTDANIYLEMKPGFFPYYFGNNKDSIGQPFAPDGTGFDSVVLCLSYKKFYGDSTKPQHVRVLELDPAETNFRFDSIYQTNYQPAVSPTNVLGEVTVIPTDLKNYTFLNSRKDSANYQIRIPLNVAFLNKIIANSDSSTNKPFNSDSLFKTVFKGFVIQSNGTGDNNGLFYINLTDINTRLEIHYRRKNGTPIDTAHSSWAVSTGTSVTKSATANYINRNRAGSQYEHPAANELFIQATPGTFANLKIPGLDTFKNSIIHRAELILEEIPSALTVFNAPAFLYVDVIDTGSMWKYKPLPYDLNPSTLYNPNTSAQPFYPTGGIDYAYFGGNQLSKIDPLTGLQMNYYVFNISRYVQDIVTKQNINYGLRVSAPYNLLYYGYRLPFSNRLAFGGIKIGNGNNPNYKLRLRIVYSKI